MDDSRLHDLLERAVGDLPPTTVSVALARSQGQRRLRLRRMLRPAIASVAAAAAVALIVTVVPSALTGGRARPDSPARSHGHPAFVAHPPSRFSLNVPYASFGWLPAGFSADYAPPEIGGAGVGGTQTALAETVGAPSHQADGKDLGLQVNAAGSCRLAGPGSRPLTAAQALRYFIRARTAHVDPLTLSCADGEGEGSPLVRPAPRVNGDAAFWDSRGDLIWEYGSGAWAGLVPSLLIMEPHRDPRFDGWYNAPARGRSARAGGHPVYKQSAATRALLLKVAASVRYGNSTPQVYGFTVSGVPASWRAAAVPTGFQPMDGRLVNTGWQLGPAADAGGLTISAVPAANGSCQFLAGRAQAVTVDGEQGLLRTIDETDKHEQTLCAADVHGLSVVIDLDVSIPGTNDTPLPGSDGFGSALAVFGHLRLLGPDPDRWSTSPLTRARSA
jgi:hypothetical protein